MSRQNSYRPQATATPDLVHTFPQRIYVERQIHSDGPSWGLSLADVSMTTGYADQSHMTREFTRLVGLTPAQFSKAAKRSTLFPSGSSTVA